MSIFNDSKYTRWYYAIIELRAIEDWRRRGEVHHIIPSSLGGSDDRSNLVKLTGHDHAWCHWLLTKMTEGDARAKMVYAFNMMGVAGDHMKRGMSYATVRAYEKNRVEWSKNHREKMKYQFENGRKSWNKGKKLEDEKYRVGGRKNKGKVHDRVVVEARAAKVVGTKQSAEASEKKRQKMLGFVRGPMSEAEKMKRSDANLGKTRTEDQCRNYSEAFRGNISINKDGVEKRVKDHQLQEFLDSGWSMGGRPRKKKLEA